jgi:hypothetical protein
LQRTSEERTNGFIEHSAKVCTATEVLEGIFDVIRQQQPEKGVKSAREDNSDHKNS